MDTFISLLFPLWCILLQRKKETKQTKTNQKNPSDILWLLSICQHWNKAVTRQVNCKFVTSGQSERWERSHALGVDSESKTHPAL